MCNIDSPLVLETPRLRVAVPTPDLAPAFSRYLIDNQQHFASSMPAVTADYFTEEECRARLVCGIRECTAGESLRLALFLHDAPARPIGTINFTNVIRGPFQACFLGYQLDHAAVGNGFMFEALRAAIQEAFSRLELHRIMANYMPTNERSGRLLKRLGFEVEGYARDYLMLNGKWEDHILTSLRNPKHLDSASPNVSNRPTHAS